MPPLWRLLDRVNQANNEFLLIKRVRVSRVAILISRRLEESNCRKISLLDSVEKVVRIILMVCCTVLIGGDCLHALWTHVIRVCRALVVLERLVMRQIVTLGHFGNGRVAAPASG